MTATETPTTAEGRAFGQRLLRKEDPRLLTGEARFIDDLQIPGALWMGMVRSPYAHARIRGIDVSAALEMPGVRHVFTGADLADAWADPMPCAWPVTEDMKAPAHWPVAKDKACYVGDIVAVVVAEDRYQAADAVDAVVVDYEPLEAVVDIEDAASDRVVVHEELGTNRSYTWTLSPEPEAVERAFAEAAHTVSETYVQQRLIPVAMEPRGVAVVPGVYGGDLTVYSSTQIPHILKVMVAATCGVPEHKVRVVAPAVGGGFGSKLNVYAEELIAVALARRLGVPTRWTETRAENAVATIQGRGQVQRMELAADAEGRVTAVRARITADMGAYLQLVTPGIPLLGAFLYHGVYDVPAYHFECTGVFTNRTPTDAYRGAGRPEATYAIERAMDALAREVGVDPAEIRRRNYIPPDRFPYESVAGLTYDSGDYEPTLDRALELVGYEELRAEQARRREAGDPIALGIGVSTYVEVTTGPYAGSEVGWVEVRPGGDAGVEVVVGTGASPHGQGLATALAMLVSHHTGLPHDAVRVVHGDTDLVAGGTGTFGSRSLQLGGSAVRGAAVEVVEQARRLAAEQLEAAADDVVLDPATGRFHVAGTPAVGRTWAEVLAAAGVPALRAEHTFTATQPTYPFGAHVAVVEVDTETGDVRLRRLVACDDAGRIVNPLLAEGQRHGGLAQGVAQALYEQVVFDDDGNPLTATFADYAVVSAAELPSFELVDMETPTFVNPLGAKGIGESGTIGSTPAVHNAVCDALAHLGVRHVDMPCTPERVWRAIRDATR